MTLNYTVRIGFACQLKLALASFLQINSNFLNLTQPVFETRYNPRYDSVVYVCRIRGADLNGGNAVEDKVAGALLDTMEGLEIDALGSEERPGMPVGLIVVWRLVLDGRGCISPYLCLQSVHKSLLLYKDLQRIRFGAVSMGLMVSLDLALQNLSEMLTLPCKGSSHQPHL